MWQRHYPDRLADWVRLRESCQAQDLDTCLVRINQWWFASPWQPYYLHWDDRLTWPDPWQLLADNVFCDVARGLGMLYTISMLEREECADCCLIETDTDNLVLVQQGKYVLNWNPNAIVNIQSKSIKKKNVLEPAVLSSLIR